MDGDGTLNIRDERSEELLTSIVALAGSREAAEYDEYDHDLLFYSFEVLFALDAHELLSWWHCPLPEVARELKIYYLSAWSNYFDKSGATEQSADQRRQVIEQTFDRFIAGCIRRHVPPA